VVRGVAFSGQLLAASCQLPVAIFQRPLLFTPLGAAVL
jgi:hypothetical protein